MKIKLTDEQRAKMDAIFANINALSEDDNFTDMLNAIYEDDVQELCTEKNEEDYMKILNFYDDLHEHSNMFMP